MTTEPTIHSIQMTGFVLWRAGLVLAGVSGFYYSAWWLLSLFILPRPLMIGGALLLTGSALVLTSLIIERYRDAHQERGLRE